jgi:hypothetical protein
MGIKLREGDNNYRGGEPGREDDSSRRRENAPPRGSAPGYCEMNVWFEFWFAEDPPFLPPPTFT